jgi:formate hydrogenlyase subunit 4
VVLGVTKIVTNRALRGEEVGLFSLPIILGTTIIFIFIIYKKGEKPRWQWGVDKGDE